MKKQPAPAKRRRGRPVSIGRGIAPTIYIPRGDADALKQIAAKRGLTLGDVVREAIHEYLG